jgi:hypothetical protein
MIELLGILPALIPGAVSVTSAITVLPKEQLRKQVAAKFDKRYEKFFEELCVALQLASSDKEDSQSLIELHDTLKSYFLRHLIVWLGVDYFSSNPFPRSHEITDSKEIKASYNITPKKIIRILDEIFVLPTQLLTLLQNSNKKNTTYLQEALRSLMEDYKELDLAAIKWNNLVKASKPEDILFLEKLNKVADKLKAAGKKVNLTSVSEKMGIKRPSIYDKMRKHKIYLDRKNSVFASIKLK